MRRGERVKPEPDIAIRPAALAAARTVEIGFHVVMHGRVVHTEPAGQRHEIDPGGVMASLRVAMGRDLRARRQHLADRVDRKRVGDFGQLEHAARKTLLFRHIHAETFYRVPSRL